MAKIIGIVSKVGKPEAAALAAHLQEQHPHVEFRAESHLASVLGWPILEDEQVVAGADWVFVLGGDGTLIHAARLLNGRPTPLLGVNLGSLGFMTEVPLASLDRVVGEVLSGKARTESRMKLRCQLVRDGQLLLEDDVLNDVVLNKSALARVADHETYCGGQFMALFKSDGMIVSTPTGSTAYAMSAGGPIVHPSLDCMVVAPICPHALTQRPVVVPPDQEIRIVLRGNASNVFLTLDGQAGYPLKLDDEVRVARSPNRVNLVKNPELQYFGVLRQKLHWAER